MASHNKRRAASSSSNSRAKTSQHADPFLLDDLPDEAIQLIAYYASTPTTPAACLLPCVCRGWRAAADRVQPLVDVRVDGLAAACKEDEIFRRWKVVYSQYDKPERRIVSSGYEGDVSCTCHHCTTPAIPAAMQRVTSLSTWLQLRDNSSSVCSLTIPCHLGVRGDSMSWFCMAGIKDAIAGWPFPRLVKLEVPALGTYDAAHFLEALPRLSSLQHLVLTAPHQRCKISSQLHSQQVADALAPLKQLRRLVLEWPRPGLIPKNTLGSLLQGLPPSIQEMQIMGTGNTGSIPLSCVTHLANLRHWEHPAVSRVVDDISNHGTTSSRQSSSSSSSRGGNKWGVAALTALTSLKCLLPLNGLDARLQAPNLRSLTLRGGHPAAWQSLQGLKQLQHVSLCVEEEDPPPEMPRGLSSCHQLLQLDLQLPGPGDDVDPGPWVECLFCLTRLTALRVPAVVLMEGGPDLLHVLTQLRELTVDCSLRWGNTRAGTVFKAVVAAVEGGGMGRLQELLLLEPPYEGQQVGVRTYRAMPGVVVEVQAV